MSSMHNKATSNHTIFSILIIIIIHTNLQWVNCIQRLDSRLASLQANNNISTTTISQPAELPDFVEPIGNQTVALGRDAQLACKISRLGNFRTAWLRVEDKGILTIHSNIITRNYRIGLINEDDGKNFILTIKNVQPSDKGGYMCQINSVPMKFAIGYLDVLTPPVFEEPSNSNSLTAPASSVQDNQPSAQPLTPPPPGTITVAEGANVSLTCRAQGHPTPEITWRREDNEPILMNGAATSEGVPKVEGNQLALSSASRLNSGAYLCIASNGVQPSASKRQVLDVQFSPVIRIPQTEVQATIQQPEARLHCFVELNPLGTYHWVKLAQGGSHHSSRTQSQPQEDDASLIEHYELTNSDKYDIVMKQVAPEKVQMSLGIRRLERHDFAWYKCIARNSLGIQSNSIRLHEASSSASSSSATSSFSFNNLFGGGQSSNEPSTDGYQPSRPNANNRQAASSRAHTRSSWLQRRPEPGTPSAGHQPADSPQATASSGAAGGPTTLLNHHLLLPFILLLLSLLYSISYQPALMSMVSPSSIVCCH